MPKVKSNRVTKSEIGMTEKLANIFAQLLNAGCPQVRAVMYLIPSVTPDQAATISVEWMRDSLVLNAVERINGGEWLALPAEKRFEIVLNKQMSELAYFLWANNFNDITDKVDLDKMTQARTILRAEIQGKVDDTDPMNAFARFAVDFMKEQAAVQAKVKSTVPPQLAKSVTVTAKES
jgi:hypothetical protein